MPKRSQRHKWEMEGLWQLYFGGGQTALGAWAAGNANTTMTTTSTRVRATRSGAGDAVVSMQISKLIAGASYRIDTSHFMGTPGLTSHYRLDATPDLPTGSLADVSISTSGAVSLTFVAPPSGTAYFGFVLTTTAVGDYAETQLAPTVTKT